MWEIDSYKSHEDHMQVYEALEKSMNHDHSKELAKDLAEARKKNKKSRKSPKTPPGSPPHQPPHPLPPEGPFGALGSFGAFGSSQVPPPPPPPTNQEGQTKGSAAPSSSKTAASVENQAWTTTDIRLKPSISLTPTDLQMDEDIALDEQAQSSDDEDIESVHIPKVNLRQDWWKPLEEERHATPEPAWSIPSSDVPVPTNNWASALAPALSISKMKAAYYPDVGLEKMVPDQIWIVEECKYDIAAMYGISHWWFQRQRFYIDRHTSEGDRSAVKTHMRILSVVRIEVFSMYGWQSPPAFDHLNQNAPLSLEPTSNKLLVVGFNSLVHSFHALSTLRRFGLRTASTAAKPCQGDSSEFYLIIGSIYTDQQETVVLTTLFNESEQRHFRLFITNVYLQESQRLQLLAKEMSIHNSMLTLQTHYQGQGDSLKTYNTASATLMYAVMFKKSVGMRVRKSQPHKKAILHSKDD
nr:hypothetical protein [Tanacetum cinerariifolium]